MNKKIYLVDTYSIFRVRYAVEAEEKSHALDAVTVNIESFDDGCPEWQELSQKHIAENIVDCREISKEEYIKLFDEENDYLKDWSEEKKMELINDIDQLYS